MSVVIILNTFFGIAMAGFYLGQRRFMEAAACAFVTGLAMLISIFYIDALVELHDIRLLAKHCTE
jgi:hypothetical protein